uniref:Uncharacterized protein n=1 Tax=Salix viminalis TaxID=40686 RepID=A0A6N2LV57_SALVM
MASSSSRLHASASSSSKLLASRILSSSLFHGKVKQIVGSTLRDLKGEDGSALVTNFESDETAAEFANLHKEDGLMGGADDLSKSIAIEELFVGLRLLSLVDWICSPLFEMLAFAISVVLPENDSSKIHFYLSHK